MPEDKDKAAADGTPTGTPGAKPDDAPKTFTEADIQKEADRRVTEARKKWQSEQESILADKTKDADAKLAELATKAEAAERYADFVDAATKAGIKNVKAAYAVAVAHGHIGKKGLDVDAFKAENPEFFLTARSSADAGAGSGSGNQTADINDYIRSQIGARR